MSRTLRMTGPVLVGVDGSDGAKAATLWGVRAAERHATSLVLLHALGIPDLYAGPTVPPTDELLRKVRVRGEAILREATALATAESAEGAVLDSRLVDDSPALALLNAAGSARLVVLGAAEHSRLVGALLGGSVTAALAGHASCPVASVRGVNWDMPASNGRPVAVGVDGSDSAGIAVTAAFAEASTLRADLVAVHVQGDFPGSHAAGDPAGNFPEESANATGHRLLAEQLATARDTYPEVNAHQVVARDDPRRELLRWSRKAQLIVVGSRGLGGFRGLFLGSTGQALIHHAACPVLIARPSDARK